MSLRDLNWRKGFFRLWLLASSIWIVAFGTFGVYPATMKYIDCIEAKREQDVPGSACKPIDPSNVQWDKPASKTNPAPGKEMQIDIPSPPEGFIIDFHPDPDSLRIPVDKFTGDRLKDHEFQDRTKDEIEYIRPGRCYDLNRIAKSKESRKHDLLFFTGMAFIPPVLVLFLGMGFMWVFSGFVPKQNK